MSSRYDIKTIQDKSRLAECDPFQIAQYAWGCSYQPEAFGRLGYIEYEGFLLSLSCKERDPKARYLRNDDPVYRDSCLEAFINFNPQDARAGYMNFEMNAAGAILCQYGVSLQNRYFLQSKGYPVPQPRVARGRDLWEVELLIPLSLIAAVYGTVDFHSGSVLRGNFFKCGDDTASPHYGSWAPIQSDHPNFHVPQAFGELILR